MIGVLFIKQRVPVSQLFLFGCLGVLIEPFTQFIVSEGFYHILHTLSVFLCQPSIMQVNSLSAFVIALV